MTHSPEKRSGLKTTPVGSTFLGFVVLRKQELKERQNGDPFLVLELGDRSGRLRAKLWHNAEEIFHHLKQGDILKVKGRIQNFQDRPELHVEKLRLAREEEIDREQLFPVSEKDVPALLQAFNEHRQHLADELLKELLNQLFPTEEAYLRYLKTPSGKLWHHNYLYGTLEHVVCLLDLADALCAHYPAVDRDLLKTGIILHAVGNEQRYLSEAFVEFSTDGRLIGRPVLSWMKIEAKIREMENFPEEKKRALAHLVLSHSAPGEDTLPVKPQTREAVLLQALRHLDITANAVERIIRFDRQPDSQWTRYNNLLDRFIYVGDETNDQENHKKSDQV